MQIVFMTKVQTLGLFIVLWIIFQVAASLLSLKLNSKYFLPGSFLFRPRIWENNGSIYKSIFKVQKWKDYLPDGGGLFKGGFRKKHLQDSSKAALEKYLIESCRAEFCHWICILPFWVFGFFGPIEVIFYMLLYALIINMPCIIAQRYNRPRISRLIRRQITRSRRRLRLNHHRKIRRRKILRPKGWRPLPPKQLSWLNS